MDFLQGLLSQSSVVFQEDLPCQEGVIVVRMRRNLANVKKRVREHDLFLGAYPLVKVLPSA